MKEMNRRAFLTLTGAALAMMALTACDADDVPVAPPAPPAPPAPTTSKETDLLTAINKVWKEKHEAGAVVNEQLTLNQEAQGALKIQGGLCENAQETVHKVTDEEWNVLTGVAGWEASMEQKYGAGCLAGVAGINPLPDGAEGVVLSLDFEYSCEDTAVRAFVDKLLKNSNSAKAEFISIYLPVVQGKTYMTAVVFRNNKA